MLVVETASGFRATIAGRREGGGAVLGRGTGRNASIKSFSSKVTVKLSSMLLRPQPLMHLIGGLSSRRH